MWVLTAYEENAIKMFEFEDEKKQGNHLEIIKELKFFHTLSILMTIFL